MEKYGVHRLEQMESQNHTEPYDQFRSKTPEQAYLAKETLEELQTAWEKITDRDRAYLGYRFGMEDESVHTPKETVLHFHLPMGRCRKTEETALKHMREEYQKEEGQP